MGGDASPPDASAHDASADASDALADTPPSPNGVLPIPNARPEPHRIAGARPSTEASAPAPAPLPPPPLPRFRRLEGSALNAHRTVRYGSDLLGYPWGIGALDVDLDEGLDLFLGGGGPGASPACLYRNTSVPGRVAFEASACLAPEVVVFGGYPLEVDGAPPRELLVAGDGVLELWRWTPALERVDLAALANAPTGCRLVALAPLDVDSDGDLDALLACAGRFARGGRLALTPDALLRNVDGDLRWAPPDASIGAGGNTLALGIADDDGDGQLDLALIVDTFSSPTERNTTVDPGGLASRRRGPGAPYETTPFAAGSDAWGSFMGTGLLRLTEGTRVRVLSDFGPLRALDAEGEDRAALLGLRALPLGDRPLFSWGVLVDDWNRDGLEDLLVTVAHVPPTSAERERAHVSRVALGRPDGRFDSHGVRVGFELSPTGDASPRSALRADFDRDGRLDLLFGTTAGSFELWTVDAGEDARCTVRVRAFYGDALEGNATFGPSREGPWSAFASLGQIGVGAVDEVSLPWNRGAIRFASGWIEPFDCEGSAGPVRVVEPSWPAIERSAGSWLVRVPDGWRGRDWSAWAEVEGELIAVELEPAEAGFRVGEGPERLLFRVDGVWLDRWRDVR